MSKVIEVKGKWSGTVTLSDPLTLPQAQLIEAGLKQPEGHEGEKELWLSAFDAEKLPAVQSCVEKWDLENFSPDPFPASPRGASHKLIDFIFAELVKIYVGEVEIPKE